MIKQLLLNKKDIIAKKWIEGIYNTYSKNTSLFFAREKDKFANPVGHTLSKEINELLFELLEEKNPQKLTSCLNNIIRIRTIQDLLPSEAISFIFILKDIIQEELKNDLPDKKSMSELIKFFNLIDKLGLMAFDITLEYHKKISEIRVNEIKRKVSGLMRRTKFFLNSDEPVINNE